MPIETEALDAAFDHEPLDLLAFLGGEVAGLGVVEDRFGRLRRRFRIRMRGRLTGTRLELDERVEFDDGEEERRRWSLLRTAEGRIEGEAEGLCGPIRGTASGGTTRLSYVYLLRLGARSFPVRIADRFHRLCARKVANRAVLGRWGVRLAEVSAVLERSDRVR